MWASLAIGRLGLPQNFEVGPVMGTIWKQHKYLVMALYRFQGATLSTRHHELWRTLTPALSPQGHVKVLVTQLAFEG